MVGIFYEENQCSNLFSPTSCNNWIIEKKRKKNLTPKLYLPRLKKKKNSYLNIIWIYTPKSDLIIISLGYLRIYQVLFYYPIRVTLNIENVSCLKKQGDKFGHINDRRRSCTL